MWTGCACWWTATGRAACDILEGGAPAPPALNPTILSRKPRALIFDLDGVIVHSTPVHNRAWERYLVLQGIPPDGIERRMHGKHNDEIVRDFFGDGLTLEQVRGHGAAKEQLYREMMLPVLEERLVAGVREFLAARSGMPMAVASNAEPGNVEAVLEGSGLRRFFGAVVDGSQVERPKPAPDVYLRAASLLGVAPEGCVVFEDSTVGVAAALAAGMRVVGLLTTADRLEGVEREVRDFTDPDLVGWLSGVESGDRAADRSAR